MLHDARRAAVGTRRRLGRLAAAAGLALGACAVEAPRPPPAAAPAQAASSTTPAELWREASALLRQGRLREALPLLRRRLEALKEARGPRHPETLAAMKPYAEALQAAGRDVEALGVLREAAQAIGAIYGERHPATLVAENDHALALVGFGDAGGEEAVERFERLRRLSVEVRGAQDPETLTILNNYALALSQTGRHAEAAGHFRQVAVLRQRLLGERHRLTLQAASSAAMSALTAGQPAQSIPALEQVLASEIGALGERDPETLRTMSNLALALFMVGRKDESLRLREHVYRLRLGTLGERLPASERLIYATALVDAGREDAALPVLEGVVAKAEQERQDAALVSGEAQQSLFMRHLDGYRLYARSLALRGALADAFVVVERTKARGLLDRLATAAALAAGAVPQDEAARLEDLTGALAELDTRLAIAADAAAREPLRRERADRARQLAELQGALKARFPRFRQMTELPSAAPGDARRLLESDGLFLSYVVSADRVESYTLDASGGVRYQAARKVPGLADAVEAFRVLHTGPEGGPLQDGEGRPLEVWRWQGDEGRRWRVVEAPGCAAAGAGAAPRNCPPPGAQRVRGRAARDELAAWLGAALLEPVAAEIAGRRRLVVSTDGPLALLPFDLLYLGGRRLVETHEVGLVHSLSVLKLLQERLGQYTLGPPRLALLAVGNPSYEQVAKPTAGPGAPPGADRGRRRARLATPERYGGHERQRATAREFAWTDLPGTAHEIDAATRIFADQGALKFDREQASERQLRRLSGDGRLAGFRYLLFSAHGYFDAGTPTASALVLARSGAEPEHDGLVTVPEWPSLRLRSDLVILSACDTARGAIVSGEGLVGLGYALYVAGNVNTTLTLWPIADEASAAFVSSFLARLKAGQPPGAALAATKREFLRHPKPAWRDPFYWAAFVMDGV